LKIKIIEHFTSLQGESTHAGRICNFIRLAGCNLRCNYCDTLYGQDFSAGEEWELAALADWHVSTGVGLIEVTGGEPLATPAGAALCRALCDTGAEVLLETNGSMPIDDVPPEVRKILDCKLPGSGMAEYNCYENYALLLPHDEVKFVVSSKADFDFAADVIKRYDLPSRTANLLVSPVWGRVDLQELAQWVIDSRLPVRMQLQMHKVIWGNKPGV
jgi:7-carboxy-7-deazaguanine synthase